MENAKQGSESTPALHCGDAHCNKKNVPAASRRSFLGRMGASTALAVGIPIETVLEGMHAKAKAALAPFGSPNPANTSFQYRKDPPKANKINIGQLPDNGDSRRFTDCSG